MWFQNRVAIFGCEMEEGAVGHNEFWPRSCPAGEKKYSQIERQRVKDLFIYTFIDVYFQIMDKLLMLPEFISTHI